MMKIVNAHSHLIEFNAIFQMQGDIEISKELDVIKNIDKIIKLLKVDALLKQMDEAGISHSVLFACDAPLIYSSNEYVSGICNKHPTRFIGLASVNPLKKNAVSIIENAIINMDLKGIKFHPPLQNFYPNDQRIYPVYEKALELNVPVVFHVGSTPFGSLARLEMANPILIDNVACNFPDLRIMLTHLGTLWSNEAFMVVEKNPNVYIDTAAYLYEIKDLLTKNTIKRIGENKIIFGTDYPMPFNNTAHVIKDFVDCILQLDIDKSIKEKIFNKNFQEFLYGCKKEIVSLKTLIEKNALKNNK